QRETLGAVAAAKALDGQLAVAPHDFEDEQVLPFGPGRMQPGHALPGAGEREETIVLHGSLPEIGRYRAVSQRELAEEPARQIDQMRALIDQLAAAGNFGLEAPLFLVTDASAMPVASADEHQRADTAVIGERLGLRDCGMEAVIEADLDNAPALLCCGNERRHFIRPPACRFLHQHVTAGLDRG